MALSVLQRLPREERTAFVADQIETMNKPLGALVALSAVLFLGSGVWDLFQDGISMSRPIPWRLDYGVLLLVGAVLFQRTASVPRRLAIGLAYFLMFGFGLALAVIAQPARLEYMLAAFVLVPVLTGALWTRSAFMGVAMAACVAPPLVMLAVLESATAADWMVYVSFLSMAVGIGETLRRQRLRVSIDIHLLRRKLQRRAVSDALTGVLNRSGWEEHAPVVLKRALEEGGDCAVLFLDIDHFKQVNDALGHAAGDRVLERVAASIRAALRDADVVARMGGEEFSALLPNVDLEAACAVAERIRTAVSALREEVPVTLSIGVSACRASMLLGDAMRRADMAMLEAKQRGRNRVVRWGENGPEDDGERRVVAFQLRRG